MKGFPNRWTDFPDYILGITREIWEERGIATLHQYYADDIIVRSPSSLVTGNQGVIAATMATLAEFPDRTLLGEDVIWSGTPEDGMLSSHRLLSTATHLGHGAYGRATGRKLTYRIIADCHAINNQINDEWLIRDQGAIVQQMGLDAKDFARDQIAREGGPDACVRPLTPATDRAGPYTGRGNDNEWGMRYGDVLTQVMGAAFSVIPTAYDRAANLFHPSGVHGYSHGDADRFWMGLRSSFPDAQFAIHHIIGRDDPHMPPRAALRWSLTGKHSGWGAFGPPSGAAVHVMGLSHAEFGPWAGVDSRAGPGIRREYVLFDEIAVWKQILLHTGAL